MDSYVSRNVLMQKYVHSCVFYLNHAPLYLIEPLLKWRYMNLKLPLLLKCF